jgi:hypothetical protein
MVPATEARDGGFQSCRELIGKSGRLRSRTGDNPSAPKPRSGAASGRGRKHGIRGEAKPARQNTRACHRRYHACLIVNPGAARIAAAFDDAMGTGYAT